MSSRPPRSLRLERVALGERRAPTIPRAHLEVLEDGAHSPNVEESESLDRFVIDFVEAEAEALSTAKIAVESVVSA